MVILSSILRQEKRIRKYTRGFIDTLRLHLVAGTGGNGLPKYGGVGGQGGDIYALAEETESLKSVIKKWPTKRIKAGHGGNSNSRRILGEPGQDTVVKVPVGITIYRDNGRKIMDLDSLGTKCLIAKGGIGGSYKTGYLGLKGQSHTVTLDLRLIADIGLVGFPNAGKSTLLKAISRAKPKIASYPFTTIKPNIGVISYKDLRSITMADLPGLIEGAHANIGMGHKFLKHVERTKMLLLVVDINGFQLSPKHQFRSCLETIILLNKELELYNSDLLNKPTMLVINKMDTEGSLQKYNDIKQQINNLSDVIKDFPLSVQPVTALKFDDIVAISALSKHEDIVCVKEKVRHILDINADNDNVNEDIDIINSLKDSLKEKGPILV